jgi:methionyl-tRNA formyltransferase
MSGVVLIGMEELGFRALETFIDLGADLPLIVTLPDDRLDKIVAPRMFDDLCAFHGKTLVKTADVNTADLVARIRAADPDFIYVVGWSRLVSDEVIRAGSQGAIGFHGTRLPRHRGRAPIPWAILFGLTQTAMTMFHLTPGTDNGLIIDQELIPIGPDDTAAEVYAASCAAIETLIRRSHPRLAAGDAPALAQDERLADHWAGRKPIDGLIDWYQSAARLYDWVRALTRPFPGAFTYLDEQKMFVWSAKPAVHEGRFEPGLIIAWEKSGLIVGAGHGALRLTEIQFEDGPVLAGPDLADRARNLIGQTFEF